MLITRAECAESVLPFNYVCVAIVIGPFEILRSLIYPLQGVPEVLFSSNNRSVPIDGYSVINKLPGIFANLWLLASSDVFLLKYGDNFVSFHCSSCFLPPAKVNSEHCKVDKKVGVRVYVARLLCTKLAIDYFIVDIWRYFGSLSCVRKLNFGCQCVPVGLIPVVWRQMQDKIV